MMGGAVRMHVRKYVLFNMSSLEHGWMNALQINEDYFRINYCLQLIGLPDTVTGHLTIKSVFH